jgi:hypothetical protein
MALPYVAPKKMEEFRQRIVVFAKGASALECIHAHFFPEKTGVCDLTREKEQEEIFVLANRAGTTLKICPMGMQIVANVVDIDGTDHWYQNMKEQKRLYKERLLEEATKREEERKALSRTVLVRKKASGRSA